MSLLKQLFTILVASGIILQNTGNLVVLLDFHANRDFIATSLCEKKDEGNNHCQGSCHLKKKLEEQQEKESPLSPARVKENNSQAQLYCENVSPRQTPLPSQPHLFRPFMRLHFVSVSFRVFHPPRA